MTEDLLIYPYDPIIFLIYFEALLSGYRFITVTFLMDCYFGQHGISLFVPSNSVLFFFF